MIWSVSTFKSCLHHFLFSAITQLMNVCKCTPYCSWPSLISSKDIATRTTFLSFPFQFQNFLSISQSEQYFTKKSPHHLTSNKKDVNAMHGETRPDVVAKKSREIKQCKNEFSLLATARYRQVDDDDVMAASL